MRTDQSPAQIAKIIATAERLRNARSACRQFLSLWALQNAVPVRTLDNPDDVLADPANHDWSLLYRGSVLDD